MNIKRIIREVSNDFKWIGDEMDPWESVPQEDINQLTEEEKEFIIDVLENESYNMRYESDCKNPTFKIDSLEIHDIKNWDKNEVVVGYTVTCREQTLWWGSRTILRLWFDRDTFEFEIA